MSQPQILIVGAGPTGLVLALRLAHHGVAFRIIDRNPGPGLASRAMVVHARTLELYDQFGCADEVVGLGIKMETMHLREHGKDVAKLNFKDMGRGLSPYPFSLSFPQDDHEHFLVGKLRALGIDVEWNVALQSFTQDDAGVTATLDRDGQTESCRVAYLCGCDGARSRVRQGLHLDFPGGTYHHLYYVADVRLNGIDDTDGYMTLDANAFVLLLPVRSSGMRRLIGIIPDVDEANDRTFTFEDIRPGAEALLGVDVAEVNWFSTYRVHHRVAAHFQVGRAFIAGDAGHIHSPAGGQGMNTGIGDAINLSWKLAQVLQGRAAPSLLDSYEAERIVFARKLVATTDRAFTGMVSQGVGGQLLRTFLLPHVMPFLTGFSAVRRMMFETVSQVRINYEDSPLSAGKAGAISGGDRLPWVQDADNFAPLRSVDWQIHVYGDADAELSATAQALGLPLHVFGWSDAADHAGLQRDAAYLVRPDAYVALAMPKGHFGELRGFAERHALRFAQTS